MKTSFRSKGILPGDGIYDLLLSGETFDNFSKYMSLTKEQSIEVQKRLPAIMGGAMDHEQIDVHGVDDSLVDLAYTYCLMNSQGRHILTELVINGLTSHNAVKKKLESLAGLEVVGIGKTKDEKMLANLRANIQAAISNDMDDTFAQHFCKTLVGFNIPTHKSPFFKRESLFANPKVSIVQTAKDLVTISGLILTGMQFLKEDLFKLYLVLAAIFSSLAINGFIWQHYYESYIYKNQGECFRSLEFLLCLAPVAPSTRDNLGIYLNASRVSDKENHIFLSGVSEGISLRWVDKGVPIFKNKVAGIRALREEDNLLNNLHDDKLNRNFSHLYRIYRYFSSDIKHSYRLSHNV